MTLRHHELGRARVILIESPHVANSHDRFAIVGVAPDRSHTRRRDSFPACVATGFR